MLPVPAWPFVILRDVKQAAGVVVVHDPGEHADRGAAQGGRVDARVLEGFPGGFQQQPLLRVGGEGLARADPEELRVELAGVVQEATVPGVAGAGVRGIRVEQGVQVPAAGVGEAGDRVAARGNQVP